MYSIYIAQWKSLRVGSFFQEKVLFEFDVKYFWEIRFPLSLEVRWKATVHETDDLQAWTVLHQELDPVLCHIWVVVQNDLLK